MQWIDYVWCVVCACICDSMPTSWTESNNPPAYDTLSQELWFLLLNFPSDFLSLFLSLWHNGRATGHMANFCRIHSFSCTTTIVRPSCYTWCATRSTCTISMTISGVLSLLWWPNILFSCSGIQLFGIHSLICSHLTSMVFFSRNMYSYSPAMRLIDHWPRTNRAIRQRQSALYLNHLCVHLIYIFLHNRRISLFCCSIEAR